MSKSLGILLHSVGRTGTDIAPVGTILAETIAEMDFSAPDAPNCCSSEHSRQRFSFEGVTVAKRLRSYWFTELMMP